MDLLVTSNILFVTVISSVMGALGGSFFAVGNILETGYFEYNFAVSHLYLIGQIMLIISGLWVFYKARAVFAVHRKIRRWKPFIRALKAELGDLSKRSADMEQEHRDEIAQIMAEPG
jgi:hypothetical protein